MFPNIKPGIGAHHVVIMLGLRQVPEFGRDRVVAGISEQPEYLIAERPAFYAPRAGRIELFAFVF